MSKDGLVCLGLVLITVLSYLFIDQIDLGELAFYIMPVLTLLTCVKALLVLHYYMELEQSPNFTQYMAYAWVVVLGSLIIFMPHLAPWISTLLVAAS